VYNYNDWDKDKAIIRDLHGKLSNSKLTLIGQGECINWISEYGGSIGENNVFSCPER
jgi:hypothetical protein